MKKLLFSSILVVLTTTTLFAQFSVTVNNGYGSAKYKGAARFIHIWANANPPNMVFDRWTGDTHLLIDPTAWHTRLNPKQKNINLTATFKNAPDWTPIIETINGREYRYYFPPNARAVVFRFHGTGGSGATFFNRVEDRFSANNFAAAGFAVVALDSNNRVDKQWDNTNNPPNNVDISNVRAMIDSFVARGLMTAATPVFSTGMSNGGAFSPRVAYALQFKAAAVYCAQGGAYINLTNVPTIWNVAQNDGNENVGANGNNASLTFFRILAARGITARHNVHLASPLYPQRFARIPGLTLADSQIIFDGLKNNDFLDRENYLRQNPAISNWQSVIPAIYAPYYQAIRSQLDVSFAEHEYFSDNDGQVIAFFNART
ncbi:MAG: hypothetical protein LH614_18655, partial [Pyrinomonadaceae bacterium]|nr:hypothetical protein [Pyrinomonadaceae bacterium]